jgi:hypothetical protein
MTKESKICFIILFDKVVNSFPTVSLILYVLFLFTIIFSDLYEFGLSKYISLMNQIVMFVNLEILIFTILARIYVGGNKDPKFCPIRIIIKHLTGRKQLDRLYDRSIKVLVVLLPISILFLAVIIYLLV